MTSSLKQLATLSKLEQEDIIASARSLFAEHSYVGIVGAIIWAIEEHGEYQAA